MIDPLLDNPDGYQIAYIKKMLNSIKNSDDALFRAYIKIAKASDQLKYGSSLIAINKKITAICEIAVFHIHSKIIVPHGKEYPLEIKLNNGFFVPKETQTESEVNDENNETTHDLETTLASLKELDQIDEKKMKTANSRKRKIHQRKNDDSNEYGGELDIDDETSSINSCSLSLNTKTGTKKTQSKKFTPNSSKSSSAKSSPVKSTGTKEQKYDSSPVSKKKKIDIKETVLTISSRESSRDNSPVIKLLTPISTKKNIVNSEITITKISKKNDDEKEVNNAASNTRTTRTSNKLAEAVKIDNESKKSKPKTDLEENEDEIKKEENNDENIKKQEDDNKKSKKTNKKKEQNESLTGETGIYASRLRYVIN